MVKIERCYINGDAINPHIEYLQSGSEIVEIIKHKRLQMIYWDIEIDSRLIYAGFNTENIYGELF